MNNLEKYIRQYCKRYKIKIAHFILIIKITNPTVYNWFSGRTIPTSKKLKTLSELLKIPMEKLIG